MSVDDTKAKPSHGVLGALSILESFSGSAGELTLAEIAVRTGVAKASALRHLKALTQMGYAVHDRGRKTYTLGPATLPLAERFMAQQPSVQACRPFLEEIAQATGETAHYAVLRGAHVIYLDIAESPRRIRAYVSRGDRQPAHCMASGKAILAFSQDGVVDAVLQAGLTGLTAHTITEARAFRTELENIRAEGFGTNLSEWMDDVGAAAAPVFSSSGQVLGAIGVAAPIGRLNRENAAEVGALVRDRAQEFTQALSGRAA